MKNYKIVSVTLRKDESEFRIKRRHIATGEIYITLANRLNKEETAFISQFMEPYADKYILQWHENHISD